MKSKLEKQIEKLRIKLWKLEEQKETEANGNIIEKLRGTAWGVTDSCFYADDDNTSKMLATCDDSGFHHWSKRFEVSGVRFRVAVDDNTGTIYPEGPIEETEDYSEKEEVVKIAKVL